jgi:hypothetical protein
MTENSVQGCIVRNGCPIYKGMRLAHFL